MIEAFDIEIDQVSQVTAARLRADPGYLAVQTIPGVGPVLGAVFVAEIGDVTRFAGPEQLTSWAGLTPRHRESDLQVHRGRITKQGSRLVRWAAIEAVQRAGEQTRIGRVRARVAARRGAHHRRRGRRPGTAHPGLLRAARRTPPLPATGMIAPSRGRARVVHCYDPLPARSPI